MSGIASIFGSGKKPSVLAPVKIPQVRQDEDPSEKKKAIGRAALIATSNRGVLNPAQAVSKKLFGN